MRILLIFEDPHTMAEWNTSAVPVLWENVESLLVHLDRYREVLNRKLEEYDIVTNKFMDTSEALGFESKIVIDFNTQMMVMYSEIEEMVVTVGAASFRSSDFLYDLGIPRKSRRFKLPRIISVDDYFARLEGKPAC